MQSASAPASAAAEPTLRRLSPFEELVRNNNPSRCYRRSSVFLESRHCVQGRGDNNNRDTSSSLRRDDNMGCGGGSPFRLGSSGAAMTPQQQRQQSRFVPPPTMLPPQLISAMVDATDTRLRSQPKVTFGTKRYRQEELTVCATGPSPGSAGLLGDHSSFHVASSDPESTAAVPIEATAVLPSSFLSTLLRVEAAQTGREHSSTHLKLDRERDTGDCSCVRVELPIQLTQDDFDDAEAELLAQSGLRSDASVACTLEDACSGRVDGIKRAGIFIERSLRLVTLREGEPVEVKGPSSTSSGDSGGGQQEDRRTSVGVIPSVKLLSVVGTKVWCPQLGAFRYGFGCLPFPSCPNEVAMPAFGGGGHQTEQEALKKNNFGTSFQRGTHRALDLQSHLLFGRRETTPIPYQIIAAAAASSMAASDGDGVNEAKVDRAYCHALHDNRQARYVLQMLDSSISGSNSHQRQGTALMPFLVDIPLDHPSSSAQHAALYWGLAHTPAAGAGESSAGDLTWSVELHLRDLFSTHGTTFNGERMKAGSTVLLLPGDAFQIGSSSREYVVVEDPAPNAGWIYTTSS